MASPERHARPALIGVAALVLLAAAAVPARSQTSGRTTGPDPTSVVDVADFEIRTRQWSEARKRARSEALRKAEQLAHQARTTTIRATTTTTTATRATTTTTAATTTTEDTNIKHPIPAGTTEAQWHALRQCESTQNYRAVNPSGRYRGAYQFSIRTWDWVSENHYPELFGVDPIDASPPDQDKMAYKLYDINGWDPWPTCKKRLPS